VKSFDFSTLPVAQPMQRSLAAVFAARCVHRWTVHTSADAGFAHLKTFAEFLASLEQPPNDFDDLTVRILRYPEHSPTRHSAIPLDVHQHAHLIGKRWTVVGEDIGDPVHCGVQCESWVPP
jgi:hypothetical protein